jgi:hypothetical protein
VGGQQGPAAAQPQRGTGNIPPAPANPPVTQPKKQHQTGQPPQGVGAISPAPKTSPVAQPHNAGSAAGSTMGKANSTTALAASAGVAAATAEKGDAVIRPEWVEQCIARVLGRIKLLDTPVRRRSSRFIQSIDICCQDRSKLGIREATILCVEQRNQLPDVATFFQDVSNHLALRLAETEVQKLLCDLEALVIFAKATTARCAILESDKSVPVADLKCDEYSRITLSSGTYFFMPLSSEKYTHALSTHNLILEIINFASIANSSEWKDNGDGIAECSVISHPVVLDGRVGFLAIEVGERFADVIDHDKYNGFNRKYLFRRTLTWIQLLDYLSGIGWRNTRDREKIPTAILYDTRNGVPVIRQPATADAADQCSLVIMDDEMLKVINFLDVAVIAEKIKLSEKERSKLEKRISDLRDSIRLGRTKIIKNWDNITASELMHSYIDTFDIR